MAPRADPAAHDLGGALAEPALVDDVRSSLAIEVGDVRAELEQLVGLDVAPSSRWPIVLRRSSAYSSACRDRPARVAARGGPRSTGSARAGSVSIPPSCRPEQAASPRGRRARRGWRGRAARSSARGGSSLPSGRARRGGGQVGRRGRHVDRRDRRGRPGRARSAATTARPADERRGTRTARRRGPTTASIWRAPLEHGRVLWRGVGVDPLERHEQGAVEVAARSSGSMSSSKICWRSAFDRNAAR